MNSGIVRSACDGLSSTAIGVYRCPFNLGFVSMTAITPPKTALELSSSEPSNPEPSSSEPSSWEPSSLEPSSVGPSILEVLASAPPARRPQHPLLKGSLTAFTTSAVILLIGVGLFTTGDIINRTSDRPNQGMGCDFGPGGLWQISGYLVGMLSIGPALVGGVYFTAYGVAKLQEARAKGRSA